MSSRGSAGGRGAVWSYFGTLLPVQHSLTTTPFSPFVGDYSVWGPLSSDMIVCDHNQGKVT